MLNPGQTHHSRNLIVAASLAVIVGIILFVGIEAGFIAPRGLMQSMVPQKATMTNTADLQPTAAPVKVAIPTAQPITAQPAIRMDVWAWNSQMGKMFANGGRDTTQGSLMAKKGVSLRLIRQDDTSQMQNDLMAFARAYASGGETQGVHFVSIMGDGAAQFLAGLNAELKKIGPDYIAEVVGSAGYSRGEDKFMGPADWKRNPKAAMGGLVAGVLRDGDWNIAMKWLADNSLANNPDEKTWDPDALNWLNTDDYIKAAEVYVSGLCEDRAVKKNNRLTGDKKHVCVQGVVTWTPGDVTVAKKRGGIVSILSTQENTRQMPEVMIGIRKWNLDHRDQVEGMLAAIFEGGDAVRGNEDALYKAASISNDVYAEKGTDANYWVRYYRGVDERDALGNTIRLGGSKVNNLADNMQLFGLLPGSGNLFAATYRTFGDIVVQQYPKLVPAYPKVEEILNTSYVANIAAKTPTMAPAEKPTFTTAPVSDVVGRKSWSIQFETGKDTFTPQAEKDLNVLYEQLLVAGGLLVEVHGHTDNVGGADFNMNLSERRAFAVKQWLEAKSASNFPPGRIRIQAHGMTQPVASNATPTGQAQNRRVEIVLGK